MSDQLTDPNEADETLEVTLGRRAPFSQLGDWVLFSGVDSDARTLYWGLSAHINTSERADTEVWPGLATLARILQLKKPENVSKFMLQLEVIGAIDVVRTMVGLVRRNRYIVHQTPPASHTGARSTSEWYALNRGPKGETAEARKEREAQFDRWLTAVRDALKAHCDKVGKARAAAKKAKAPFPAVELFMAPLLAAFRTPWPGGTARPAVIQKAAGQPVPPGQGVRTPWPGGPVPPGQGVERDQHQLDQPLSPVSSASEHPADPTDVTNERESGATRKKDQEDGGADVAADTSAAKPVVDAWAEGMKAGGRTFLPKRAKLIATEAAELLAAGADVDHLCRVAEWMGRMKPTWKILEDAMTWPEAPQPSVPGQRSGPAAAEMCGQHSAFEAGDCPPCRRAERKPQQRGASEPDSIDGAGLLARLRAGQPA